MDAIVYIWKPVQVYWANNFDLIKILLLTATSAEELPLNSLQTGVQHQGDFGLESYVHIRKSVIPRL